MRVRTADNPLQQAWAIHLSLQLASGQSLFIGSVSPYPIDRAGSFTVPIPTDARASLAEHGGVLISELQAASGQPMREPLTIEWWATWEQSP